jgi:hypothetical protein
MRPDATIELRGAVVTFLMGHADCVHGGGERHGYTDAFRLFVLELREQHADLDLEHLTDAAMVPLGTLKDWLGAEIRWQIMAHPVEAAVVAVRDDVCTTNPSIVT